MSISGCAGASFFQDLHDGVGGGYPGETLDALWGLVWKGMVTNDGVAALRAYCERSSGTSRPARKVHKQGGTASFRSRRTTPPTGQGRWALQAAAFDAGRSGTEWSHAMAQQLLTRYGVVFRETAHAENLPGGFSAVYDVLKAMEESGRIRRGYFAADLGATQFAMPAAVDLLRSLRISEGDKSEMLQLAATDPANPYGALLRWPAAPDAGSSLTRSVGARVILCNGALVAYLRRGNPNVQVFLPEEEPQRSQVAKSVAEFFVDRVQERSDDGDVTGGDVDRYGEWSASGGASDGEVFVRGWVCGCAYGVQCAKETRRREQWACLKETRFIGRRGLCSGRLVERL